MTEMILPGTYIEVRDEGLIQAGAVSVGNIGIVGTASKGPVGEAVILSGMDDAREYFGNYDPWTDGTNSELTLVRALEQAYRQGATTVFAVRVAGGDQMASSIELSTTDGSTATPGSVTLKAKTPGRWGDLLSVNVATASEDAFIEKETHKILADSTTLQLNLGNVTESARNRILHIRAADNKTVSLKIDYYTGTPVPTPDSGHVSVGTDTGLLTFATSNMDPKKDDEIIVSYSIPSDKAMKVTLKLGEATEVFTVASVRDLANDLARESRWVETDPNTLTNADYLPILSTPAGSFTPFTGGNNGETAGSTDYEAGLAILANEPAHIIVAAGQDESFGDELAAHCQNASSDAFQRERIAVVGSGVSGPNGPLNALLSHSVNSDRVIFVGPGIKATDAASTPPREVTLPGSYTAAAIAGMISGLPAHRSPTNKVLNVGGLEAVFNKPQLEQLVTARVLVLEQRQGIKVVKGITTATNSAWHQITTRRIVDYAKFGVRSAANPYIGKLNNERVRAALKGSINGFLADMIDREMLVEYSLEVSATRDQQIRGEAHVAITLKPTFSIDFIRVVMTLQ